MQETRVPSLNGEEPLDANILIKGTFPFSTDICEYVIDFASG